MNRVLKRVAASGLLAGWAGAIVAASPAPAQQPDPHPLARQQYERLQLGQFSRARDMAEQMQAAADRTGSDALKDAAASMRARYVVDAGRWAILRDADDFGNLDELLAIGISAARSGNVERAEEVAERLRSFASKDSPEDVAVTIMESEVSALAQLARGRTADAIDTLRIAAEKERQLSAGSGPPRPIKPAQELLGEVLLQAGLASEAREAFERARQRTPNRSAALLGLARAVTAAGDRTLAARHYATLLETWRQADADRPEIAEARAAVAAARNSRMLTPPVLLTLLVLGTAAIVVWSLRTRPLLRRVSAWRSGGRAMRSRKRSGP